MIVVTYTDKSCKIYIYCQRVILNWLLCFPGWDVQHILGRPNHGWEDDIKKELRETGLEVMDIELVYDTYKWHTVVSTLMNHQVPQSTGNLLRAEEPLAFLEGPFVKS